MLLMKPSMLCDAIIDITWQKSHVWPCFNHPDMTNKIVPLTMSSVSYAACTGANSITSPESCHTLFKLCSPDEQNDAIDNFSAQLPSYCLLGVVILSMPVSPEI